MKKPYKVLSATALAAVLATSSLVPVIAQAAPANQIKDVIVSKDGVNYKMKQSQYDSLVDAGKVPGTVAFITSSTGKTYTINQFNNAIDSSANVDEALTKLDTTATAQNPTTVDATFDSNGNLVTTPVAGDLKVESVKAINAKELQVTFNTPVEESSVTGTNNTLLNVGIVELTRTTTTVDANAVATGALPNTTNAKLSADGKTLTITAATGKYFKGNYDVKVSNAVKKDTTDVIANTYKTFTANDVTAPTVTDAKYNVATDKFELTFSKPVDAKTGEVVRINGQPVAAGQTALNAFPSTKLIVDRPSTVAPGTTATIYVAGIKDAAGNLMTAYNGSVLVAQDTAALAVDTVEQFQNQKVRVTFNKALNGASDTKIKVTPTLAATPPNGLVVTKSNGVVTDQYTVVAAPAAVNKDGNKYDITLNDATYANGNTENFSITFVDEAFVGQSGTKNTVYTKNITLTKDLVKPTIQSVKVAVDGESVEVTLDKAIQTVTQANVKLRRNGAELTPVTASLKAGTDNILVVKTTDASAVTGTKLNAGTYQVRLEAGSVTDMNGNLNATVNATSVSVTGDSTVDPAGAAIVTAAGNNTFTVTAPGTEKFTAASLNSSNFVLDGQTIPANSDITLDSATNKVITIKLPVNNSVNIAGSALLTATGLSYVSGNPYATSSATVAVVDNTPATLTSSTVLGNTLELTFDEAVAPATLATIADILADFEIKSDAGKVLAADTTAAAVQGSNTKKVVITFTNTGSNNFAAVVAGNNLTVTTLENAATGKVTTLKDLNGVLVKAPIKVSITQ